MLKITLISFLILLILPFSQGFSQEYSDNEPTLSVALDTASPFVYKDSEGYSVVVGMVENNNQLTSVSNIQIKVNFYDDLNPTPLEVAIGSTVMDVIPRNGMSPYMIRSETPNPNISEVSVSLLPFSSSSDKEKGLLVYSNEMFSDNTFRFSGVLQNGGAPSSDNTVHLAFYDGFDPPRILSVSSVDVGNLDANSEISFDIEENIDVRSVGFLLFAESDIFYSDFVDVKIPVGQALTKLVTISDVSVKDEMGNTLSEIKLGSSVKIESETRIQFGTLQSSNETPYTYYVQIKESGKNPKVEYIAKYDGRFVDAGFQSQIVDWIPEKKGLFFIETFVWDRNNIPIAEQGPFVLIVVN